MKRRRLIIIMIAIITGTLTALHDYLEQMADKAPLPPMIKPYLSSIWPVLFVVNALVAGLTELQKALEPKDVDHPASAQESQYRQRMLEKVRAFWITGVLEHSLHQAALLTLGLSEQQDAIANPWRLVIQQPDQPESPLPPRTSIIEVYEDAGGELLILGEPGSGKTTLLLQLTRHLLDHAEQDDKLPMPVVFNLSSWATKHQPLAQWLVEELTTKYQVSRKLGQAWINNDQIVLLLDGLDEVTSDARAACVDAINTYRKEHMVPTVVCSRRTEYLTQTKRLALLNAVVVQPLTVEQIDAYLSSAGSQLAAVRVALNEDQVLQELATTPLMLNILILTYRGLPLSELTEGGSSEARQEQLLASYVQHMLKRPRAETRYTPEQTTRGLSRLAGQMKRQGQTIFHLEQIQPTWLAGKRMLRVYDWLAVRLPGMLMGMLVSLAIYTFFSFLRISNFLLPIIFVGGLLGGLLNEGSPPQQPTVSGGKARSALGPRLLQWLLIGALIGLGSGLSVGLSDGLSFGLINGLSYGLCSILLQFLLRKNTMAETRSPAPPPAKGTIWQRLFRRKEVHNGLLVGLVVGLLAGLINGLDVDVGLTGVWLYNGPVGGLSVGLSDGLSVGLVVGLSAWGLSILLIGRSTAVQPTDLLVWSWRSLGKSLFSKSHASTTTRVTALIGLVVGLSAGLSFGLINGMIGRLIDGLSFGLSEGLGYGLSAGLSAGLSYWLLLGLSRGVSGATIEDQHRVIPNQGIHRSALNGLLLGLISAVIVGLLACLSIGLGSGLSTGLSAGLQLYLTAPGYGLGQLVGGLSLGLRYGLSEGLISGLPAGLLAGLSLGLLVGLLNGGLASFRHYVVRFLLWRRDAVPWHYVPFLDYAAEQILLRKVGGGYIFIHRLLLDYFASLEKKES